MRLRRAFAVRESLRGLPADVIVQVGLYWREVECPPLETLLPDVHWYLADVRAGDRGDEIGYIPPCWAVAEHNGVLYRHYELNDLLAAVGVVEETTVSRRTERVAVFFYLLYETAERLMRRPTLRVYHTPDEFLPANSYETGTARDAFGRDSSWQMARRMSDSLNKAENDSLFVRVPTPEVEFTTPVWFGPPPERWKASRGTPETLDVPCRVGGAMRYFELLQTAGELKKLIEGGEQLQVYDSRQTAR